MSTIAKIQEHAQKIASGEHETVKPGQEVSFTEACSIGDAVRQGDLYLMIVDSVPDGYIRVPKSKMIDKQLVPGNTQGSKHCLDSLNGVEMHRPAVWNDESLDGPCLVLTENRTVLHPVHGSVNLLKGLIILCGYQREWSKEQAKERRARD